MKICKHCEKGFEGKNHSIKYCADNCRRLAKNLMHKKGRAKKKEIEKSSDYRTYLLNNILKCIKEKHHLTLSGFNEVSDISTVSYINHFNTSWYNILELVNLEEKLFEYVVQEYVEFVSMKKKQSMHLFVNNHNYMTYELLQSIGIDLIYKAGNIRKLRYTDEELEDNFQSIKIQLGRIPLFSEFEKLSRIAIQTYAERFKLKGVIYLEVLKSYCSDQEIIEYKKFNTEYRRKIGVETGKLSAKHSEDEYEYEFQRVVNFCCEEYGKFPTKELFNRLSNIDESSYRNKFSLRWSAVCLKYGYTIEKSNRSEKMLLNLIQKITETYYIPQEKFEWLKNENGYSLFCDGYFPNLNLVVEFDGVQHRIPVEHYGGVEGFNTRKKNDEIKNILIPKNGIKLLRIDSRERWESREYLIKLLREINVI